MNNKNDEIENKIVTVLMEFGLNIADIKLCVCIDIMGVTKIVSDNAPKYWKNFILIWFLVVKALSYKIFDLCAE